MRITKNKRQVLEALAFIDATDNCFPPHSATSVQRILRHDLGFGAFDLPNLTRTLKALVDQGLAKSTTGKVFFWGGMGCINRSFDQGRTLYWPADLDLDAMTRAYKSVVEERELRGHNALNRLWGLREYSMEEYLTYKAEKEASKQ